MSSEERRKILQMVADGKISEEEAATLMRALEESAEGEVEVIQVGAGSGSGKSAAPEFDEVRKRARRLAAIPLWLGVAFTVLSAWGLFAVQQNSGYNFWFFCLLMPLLLGIFLMVLGAGGGTSRWLYLNVDRSNQSDWPRHLTLAFPLPLGFVGWFLQTFGSRIEGLKHSNVDEVARAIALTKNIKEPLIVNVDDTEDGERVQIYIG